MTLAFRTRAARSLLILAILAALLASVPSGAKPKDRKKPVETPRTFAVEEAGVELMLNASWFPQPASASGAVLRTLTSLRDLSQITITAIPFQVELTEDNIEEKARETEASVRLSHPDFTPSSHELLPGSPPRLHIEGTWQMEAQPIEVGLEVFAVKGRSVLIVLVTQKNGGAFRRLADLLKSGVRILDPPLPVQAGTSMTEPIAGVLAHVKLTGGWRPALKEELAFVAEQMNADGLYGESGLVEKQVTFVLPSLARFSPTLTFRSAPGAVPVSEQNLPKFEKLYRDRMAAAVSSFTPGAVSIETLGGISSFKVEGTTQRADGPVRSTQFFVPAVSDTVIVTLNRPEDPDGGEAAGILGGVTFTIKLEPTPPTVPAAGKHDGREERLLWVAAAVAAALLILVIAAAAARAARGKKRRDG
jgi:hypothetical protein